MNIAPQASPPFEIPAFANDTGLQSPLFYFLHSIRQTMLLQQAFVLASIPFALSYPVTDDESLFQVSSYNAHTNITSQTLEPFAKHEPLECADLVRSPDQCAFVRKYCNDENIGLINYLETYYCSTTSSSSVFFVLGVVLWLSILFMDIGIAASDYLCPNLNTISKLLGLSESLAGVTFLALGNGSPDVFSTYAAMKIGSGSLAIGELIGAASFITAVVTGSMAIIRPFKVARRPFVRDILFFTTAVSFSMYFMSDGVLRRWECFTMLAIYATYVAFVVGWHWYKTTRRRQYLVETRARDFYTEAGHEAAIEEDEEIVDEQNILTQGLDVSAFNASSLEENPQQNNSLQALKLPSRSTTPRGSFTNIPLASSPLWHDQLDDEQEEAYIELTKGMRLRTQKTAQAPTSGSSSIVAASAHPGPYTPITPIRPSLFGALEFRNVLQQLQDSRGSTSNVIPLRRRSHESNESDEFNFPAPLSAATASYVQSQLDLQRLGQPNERKNSSTNNTLMQGFSPRSDLKGQNISSSQRLLQDYSAINKSWSSLPMTSPTGSLKSHKLHNKITHKALPKLKIPQLVVTDTQDTINHSNTSLPLPTSNQHDTSPNLNINPNMLSPTLQPLKSPLRHSRSPSPSSRPITGYFDIPPKRSKFAGSSHSSITSINNSPPHSLGSNYSYEDNSEAVSLIDSDIEPSASNLQVHPSNPQLSSPSQSSNNSQNYRIDIITTRKSLLGRLLDHILPTIPPEYVEILTTLFPSLVGVTSKSWITVITSLASAPAIFLLNITVPVIEAETMEKEEDTVTMSSGRSSLTSFNIPDYNSDREQNTQNTQNIQNIQNTQNSENIPSLTFNDQPFSNNLSIPQNAISPAVSPNTFHPRESLVHHEHTNDNDLLLPRVFKSYVPITRWLLVTQAVFGPLFVLATNTENGFKLTSTLLYWLISSFSLLSLIYLFIPERNFAPSYVQFVSLVGFVIAISWISAVANEVVAILKALGIILHISDAVLGLTVFAIGNSLGDLVANTTVAKMGFPMMALSACFGGPMLNILVGIGMSGLLVMPKASSTNPQAYAAGAIYDIKISSSLIISSITLLITLVFLLVTIPLNKWKMTRPIGIVTVSFWVISTIINVLIEVFVIEK